MKNQKGFTLVELMIVVAIIGILAAIAIPKFADMLEKSREGATKGNLSSLKSAVSIFYGDQQGLYLLHLDTNPRQYASSPISLAFIPTYMDTIPGVKATGKNKETIANGGNAGQAGGGPGVGLLSASVTTGDFIVPVSLNTFPPTATDGKGWRYNNADGSLWVNSTLKDMAAKSFTLFGYE